MLVKAISLSNIAFGDKVQKLPFVDLTHITSLVSPSICKVVLVQDARLTEAPVDPEIDPSTRHSLIRGLLHSQKSTGHVVGGSENTAST